MLVDTGYTGVKQGFLSRNPGGNPLGKVKDCLVLEKQYDKNV